MLMPHDRPGSVQSPLGFLALQRSRLLRLADGLYVHIPRGWKRADERQPLPFGKFLRADKVVPA